MNERREGEREGKRERTDPLFKLHFLCVLRDPFDFAVGKGGGRKYC